MAARTPRRSFATPFVITLAAAPACFVSSSTAPSQPINQPAPGQPTEPDPQPQKPRQDPVIVANPPHPSSPPPPDRPVPNSSPPPQTWTVLKTATGCEAFVNTECPANATCNPPPPTVYACPANVKLPAKITTWSDACVVVREPITCPQGAMCNPPPPQKVACPR